MALQIVSGSADNVQTFEERVIIDVRRAEDGWNIEVEDTRGRRLWYWLAGARCIPRAGDRARFYGGIAGRPIRNVEINGRSVYAD